MATMATDMKTMDQSFMEVMKWKTRMSVLWVIQAVAFATLLILALLAPETTRQGLDTQTARFAVSVIFFISCVMAWFCVALKNSASRWLSLIFGVVFAVCKLLSMSGVFSSGGTSGVHVFHEFWGFLGAILIIWYAWKWPKQEA